MDAHGYTGPRHVTYDPDGFALRPPGSGEDNPHSILDVADIVYIDPVATGFSRMVEGEPPHRYHGVDVEYATTLPQYTATAWYHGQLPSELQSRPLRDVLDEAEAFAMGEYLDPRRAER